jgi:hypothetical protein
MSKKTLQSKAHVLFAPRLAKAVVSRITAKKKQSLNKPSHPKAQIATSSVATPQSLATLWQGDRLFGRLGTGSFEGRIQLLWEGMDQFIYRVDTKEPFAYTTSNGKRISPKLMETDGGSIPRVIRGLSKFSSWGYAPAFIIHDWLFVAHKCGNIPDNSFTFEETALVMAEAIKTLMVKGIKSFSGKTVRLDKEEDTLFLMYEAISSSIAKRVWNDMASVNCLT